MFPSALASRVVSRSSLMVNPSRFLSAAAKKHLKEGDRVPNVIFKARVRDASLGGENPFKWKDVTTADLFAKKRVVFFALPGGSQLLLPLGSF